MNSFELAVSHKNLPTKLEELVPMSFIGSSAVKFYREKIKLMGNLKMSEEQRAKTLKDGQDAGICLLEIEARIGELLPSAEDAKKLVGASTGVANAGKSNQHRKGIKPESIFPEGIDRYKAQTSRAIKNNPSIVKEAIAEAIANDDIPTKSLVMTKIKMANYMKKHPAVDRERPGINKIALFVSTKLAECWYKLEKISEYQEQIAPGIWQSIKEHSEKIYNISRSKK